MNLEANIRPISYIKTHAAEMLQQINDTQNPIVITQNGLAKGVLLDTRTYQEMIDAIGILKVLAQGETTSKPVLRYRTRMRTIRRCGA